MRGDERRRYCGQCRKHVYNLSAMTESEALDLVNAPGKVCIRFYRRPDGSVMTSECGPGKRKRWRGYAWMLAIVGLHLSTPGIRRAYAGDNPMQRAPVPEKTATPTPRESLGRMTPDVESRYPPISSETQPDFFMGDVAAPSDHPTRPLPTPRTSTLG